MAENVSNESCCGNCLHNDDCLCDLKGFIVSDDDNACKDYKKENVWKK